jgi:hypothetical protein
MSHKVAVTIKMLEYANSTEICQDTLIDTIKHMQELLDEVDQVKDVMKMLEEPED